jgi:RNA polymerase sigma-70 factor (ECF subfamily)
MDSELLGHLIDRYAASLELYARQWCDAPEDVVQEAFLKLASQARSPDNVAAWLFRVVRHRAINAGIAGDRRRRHEAAAAVDHAAWFEEESSAGSGLAVDPESVQAALLILPGDQREVIVARVWGGLSFEQVAELVGSSSSSVHRLYQSGLTTLRERLGVSCRSNTSRRMTN